MIILGVDPGFTATGFGVLKKEASKAYLLDYGFLRLPAAQPLAERVALFYDSFADKMQCYGVTDVALETPFLGKNAQSFLKLGYLRGCLYVLAHKYSANLHEFSPTQVKLSVTGYGAAGKDQVARVVLQLFPRLQLPERYDVTDALAITLCGLWHQKQSLRRSGNDGALRPT